MLSWKGSDLHLLPPQLPGGGENPAHIYLPLFHLSSGCVSFLSWEAVGFAGLLPSDPVEYNIKLRGGEKTCSALKSSYVKTIPALPVVFPSSPQQESSKVSRTLQAIHSIWTGTRRLFCHFDWTKFLQAHPVVHQHRPSFNLVSPSGRQPSRFMRNWGIFFFFFQTLYRFFSFLFFNLIFPHRRWMRFRASFTNWTGWVWINKWSIAGWLNWTKIFSKKHTCISYGNVLALCRSIKSDHGSYIRNNTFFFEGAEQKAPHTHTYL